MRLFRLRPQCCACNLNGPLVCGKEDYVFLPDKFRESGMTCRTLARRLGVNHVTVWRWVSGRGVPNPMLRPKLVELGFDDGQYIDNGPAWMVTSRDVTHCHVTSRVSGDGAP